jgi:hypothetical protein
MSIYRSLPIGRAMPSAVAASRPRPPPRMYRHLYSRIDACNVPEEGKFAEFLHEYNRGGWSVRNVVQFCATYRGRHTHLLWERSNRFFDGFYVMHCFYILSESKLVGLLHELIRDNPDFPLLQCLRRRKVLLPRGALGGSPRGARAQVRRHLNHLLGRVEPGPAPPSRPRGDPIRRFVAQVCSPRACLWHRLC